MSSFQGYTIIIFVDKETQPVELKFLPEKLTWNSLSTMVQASTHLTAPLILYHKNNSIIESIENQQQLQQLVQQWSATQGIVRLYGDKDLATSQVFTNCASSFARLGAFVDQYKDTIQNSRRLNRAIGVLASLMSMDQSNGFEQEFEFLELMAERKEKKHARKEKQASPDEVLSADEDEEFKEEDPMLSPDFSNLDPRFMEGVFLGDRGRKLGFPPHMFDSPAFSSAEFGPGDRFAPGRGGFGGRGGRGGRGGHRGFSHRGFWPDNFGRKSPEDFGRGGCKRAPMPFEFEEMFKGCRFGGPGMHEGRGGRGGKFGRGCGRFYSMTDSEEELILGRFFTDGHRHHGKCRKREGKLKNRKQNHRERLLEKLATLSLSESEDDDLKLHSRRGKRGHHFSFAA